MVFVTLKLLCLQFVKLQKKKDGAEGVLVQIKTWLVLLSLYLLWILLFPNFLLLS